MAVPPRAFPGESSSDHTELMLTLIALGTLGCALILLGLGRRHDH